MSTAITSRKCPMPVKAMMWESAGKGQSVMSAMADAMLAYDCLHGGALVANAASARAEVAAMQEIAANRKDRAP